MYKIPYYNKLIVSLILIFFILLLFGDSDFFYYVSFDKAEKILILLILVIVFGKQYKSINEIKDKHIIDLYKTELKKNETLSYISKNKEKDIENELKEQLREIENKIITITQEIDIIDKIINENNKNT